ncbi:hypothetical protein POM88_007709 [Heracleum sosnowskyi]|uniref:Transposase-associated domain-containing protein n=1 Tax=Heracleum sosnowskyi TaxID=360622 RepID=A0AAD8N6Q5_9APIA|nr:hypothetical protein POM88_007709 [Heracleum sosnowskyi]
MASDHSWVGRNRYNEAKYLTEEYKSGVDNFIKFAIYNLQEEDNGLIRCPCKECKNKYYKNPSTVKVDLYRHGIMQWYTRWDCHGEKDMPRDEVGTSSVNTNYRDDDMYDAYDDDFEDCFSLQLRRAAAMAEKEGSIKQMISFRVPWAGPKSKKSKGNDQGRSKKTSGGGGEAHKGSDEESHVKGSWEVGNTSQQIIFERKRRSCSEGDYPKKPPPDAKPTLRFTKNGKGFRAAKPKKTLGHIVRMKWDENTLKAKGAKREEFYNTCINSFKDYYEYPKNYLPENGDRVVRAHLKRNFRSYLNKEKERLEDKVNNLLDCGYRDIDIKILNPHYFSQRTWNAICDHWGTPQFAMRSELGQKARLKLEFTSHTGAIPYEQRREGIDEEREDKGEMPITDEEFLTMLYDPNDPAVKDLQEKMKNARSSQDDSIVELSQTDQPPSPRTQMEIYRIKDIISTMQARPPKKGRIILHPQDTVGELIGAYEATRWTNQPKIDNCHDSVALPDKFYQMMSTILDEVRQMIRSLPMREVKQSILDQELRNLATAAFPDPNQKSLQTHYIRTAGGLLPQILKDAEKVIVEEEVLSEKSMEVDKTAEVDKVVEVNRTVDNDEDLEAEKYPLA